MNWLKPIFDIIAGIVSIFKFGAERKKMEEEKKNEEPFVKREEAQIRVKVQDNDEKLIKEVDLAKTKEEEEKALDEIRKRVAG